MAAFLKWLVVLVILMVTLTQCDVDQEHQRRNGTAQRRRRPVGQDGSSRRERRHRSDKAKLVQHYLKKNGRLEGMVRLVDGLYDFEG